MSRKSTDMQAIFSQLSERNKDLLILIAQAIKVAQDESTEKKNKPPKQTA